MSGEDPGAVVIDLREAAARRAAGRSEGHPTEADRIRIRQIAVELDHLPEAEDLPDLERRLLETTGGPAWLWNRLAGAASDLDEHDLALRALERAAAVARDEGADDEARFDLAVATVRAANRAGRIRVAEHHLATALRLADLPDRPDALARVLALRPDPGMNVDDAWPGRFDEAWRRLGPVPSVLGARLLRAQVYATYLTDPDRAVALAERAGEMAALLDDDRATEAALDARRLAAVRAESPDALRDPGEDLVALATRRDDREAAAKGYEALLSASLLSGDEALLDRSLDGYSALVTRSAVPRHRLAVAGTRTLLALLRGDLDRAERQLAGTVTLASSTGDPLAIQTTFAQQAMVAIERDRRPAAPTIGDDRLERNPLLRWWRLAALLAACRPGNEAEVADRLECLLPGPEAVDGWRYVWLGELVVLADAATVVGDVPRARALRDALLPNGDRYATLATTVGLGSVWRPLAGLASVLGDDARARREYDLAEAANRRIGAVPWLARTRLARAPLLCREGRIDEARDQVTSVAATAERLDLRRLAVEAETARAALDGDSAAG